MKIVEIQHIQLNMPLKSSFVTSYGVLKEKAFDLYFVCDERGNQGIGELVSFEVPDYIEETIVNDRHIIKNYLLPLLKGKTLQYPTDVWQLFQTVQGNYMAKSAIETAIWDLYAKRQKQPLSYYFPTTRDRIPVGVSVGMHESTDALIDAVKAYVEQGYTRIKLKIKPENDYVPLKAIREAFPTILLMADANSAYDRQHMDALKRLDTLNLSMIEQPFHPRDFVLHQQLQQQMQTAICLDENIRSLEDVQTAHALQSCQSINLKIPRVGGITEALRIVEFCDSHQLTVWLGGMFESGVGRALNLQFASQQSFQFPGDISASDRYYYEDIVTQPVTVAQGEIIVPSGMGIGVELNWEVIHRICTLSEKISLE
ncbi:o-succinylbenzoate synthase [Candidatus Enterococcus willemsii]|uniref:o-succinylbenzoate synthase n=1 Tax=Candidatus Enterococcus willemsii TaxID=1857215 RepID=A0ABQ6YW21_9ENTE|nr:o-succinylbenzoate synthase [Enterococcus sp. CU12B]KAF1301530.1 o-succinylbenzoate synthase [Enterococcus sp. CU12B]